MAILAQGLLECEWQRDSWLPPSDGRASGGEGPLGRTRRLRVAALEAGAGAGGWQVARESPTGASRYVKIF